MDLAIEQSESGPGRGLSRLARALSGPDAEPASYLGARRIFLTLLGLAFLAAFVSFARQADGLIGSGGIVPLDLWDWDDASPASVLERPTLFWLGRTDAFLHAVCWVGAFASIVLMLGVAPRASLLAAWIGYLSLVQVGYVFTGYQWDALLLETGFLALFIAPARILGGWRRPPSRAGLFLLRFLLFRLVFLSGLVKLTSGDPTWHSLRALDYHYWTQPIPSWLSYHADRLPAGLQELSVVAMFAVELVLPFLLFGPRRLRLCAFLGLTALQIAIALTGNYGFFNLLTFALCVLVLDDQTLRARLPRFASRLVGTAELCAAPPALRAATAGAAVLLAALATVVGVRRIDRGVELPAAVDAVLRATAPYHLANGYGLFQVMTTRRHELVLEASADGEDWEEIEFRYKPGDPRRAPPVLGLHMPRLDWQMWFAALRGGEALREDWFVLFLKRLLEGAPAVRDLVGIDPAVEAPRFLRVRLYDYRFASPKARARDGRWWKRSRPATLLTLTLRDGRLTQV